MNMNEIRKMAKDVGINAFGKSKVVLVREIQRKQGHFDCFATVVDFCDQFGCCFREACFKEAARLNRNSQEKIL